MKEDRKTYEDGLAEAWNLAKKMFLYPHEGGYSSTELEEIFGRTEHLWEMSPQEAAAKIAEWKSKEEIHVGDVLKNKITGKKVVVSCVKSRNEKNAFAIYPDGSCGEFEKSEFIKTGRTIDIAALLAQIGGTDNA